LLSSWLTARRRVGYWYHIDAGDDDSATFFAYLIEQVRAVSGGDARGLPYLTKPYVRNTTSFARRFFRQFFAVMPPGVLVFDNHHEAASSSIDPILRELVGELPPPYQLYVISRSDIPSLLLRYFSTGQLARIGWDELRFTESETGELLSMRGDRPSLSPSELHTLTDGWAAGIMLLSIGSAWRSALPARISGNMPEALFAYFTQELFTRLAAPEQKLLLKTSCFRQFSATMAERLCAHPNAATLLDSLYYRHYFTERRFSSDHEYRYHDLFRSYLKQRALREFGDDRWRQILSHAASILLNANEVGQAADLYIEAGDWPCMCALIRQQSERMLGRGQWRTVRAWLSALPEPMRCSDPWLMYWQGMADTGDDLPSARASLEESFKEFTRVSDMTGRLRACTSIIDVYFQEWNTTAPLDGWTTELQALLSDDALAEGTIRLEAVKSLATALLYRHPTHALLPSLMEEIQAAWPRVNDVNKRLLCVSLLFDYFSLMGDFTHLGGLVERSRADAGSEEALPVNTFLWWRWTGVAAYREGRFETGREHLSTSIEIGLRHGLLDQAFIAQLALAMLEASCGRLERAAELLAEMRSTLDPTQHMHAVGYHYMDLWLAAAHEDIDWARRIWETFSRMPVVGVPVNCAYNLPVIWYLCATTQERAALERVEGWLSILAAMHSPLLRFNLLAMKAYAQLRAHDVPRALATVREFMELGARYRYSTLLTWLPEVMAVLCMHALEHDIEVAYVRWLIRERRIPCPPGAIRWPWAVEIRTLGGFEILLHGRKLEFAHKAPKKPLALLKALIAAGPRGLSKEQAECWLWPELDGDAAAQAMTSALLRLRRLLDHKEAIRLENSVLTLDEQSVWVDAFRIEADATPEQRRRALVLYRGTFLPTDDGEAWTVPARNRLRAKFVAAVEQSAQRAIDSGQTDHAIECLRQAIAVEPLADKPYLMLMRVYVQQERLLEAAGVFEQLHKVFGAAGGSKVTLPPDLQRSLMPIMQLGGP